MSQIQEFNPKFEVIMEKSKEKLGLSNFDKVFFEVVDSTFNMLGKRSKQIVYKCLDINYGITMESVSSDIATFAKAIEDIFGDAARLIEIRIMRLLYQKLQSYNIWFEDSNFSFVDYIERVRFFF